MPHAEPLPHPLSSQPFAIAQATEQGISRSRLRAADLESPFHGVRSALGTDTDRPRAYAARMADRERFTHTTAALLLGLRMPSEFREGHIHVGVPRPMRAPRTAGVVGHQVPAGSPLHTVSGLRVSPAVLAWVQCAAILSVDDLIVMGDGLVSRKQPIATLSDLRQIVSEHAGARGIRKLQRALRDIRAGADSAMETVLRLLIIREGFPEPEVNGAIMNEHGAVVAHGDLLFRKERVVVEYDGAGHWERGQYVRDIARLDEIMELGWRVIRVDSGLLARRAVLLGKLRRALATTR